MCNFNQIIFFISIFYIYFNKNQTYTMSKIYQPIVIERTKEIIETLVETDFFLDYGIGVTDFAAVEFGATPEEIANTREAIKGLLK